jgi:type IV secretory pathway VirJ component
MKSPSQSRWAAAIAAALYFLCASPVCAVDGGRYGQVKIIEASGSPRGVVIFFTDRGGFAMRDDAIAENLARAGALVAEVDTAAYLDRLDQLKEKCHQLVGDAEWVSRGLQRQYHFQNYFTPIMAGVGQGGTIAGLILSQAPAVTIAGAVALDPSASLTSRHPICAAGAQAVAGAGFSYGPPKNLPGYWVVGLTPAVSTTDRRHLTGLRKAGAHLELHEIAAGVAPADALRDLIAPHLALPKEGDEISSLPLSIMPVAHPSKLMAVVLSGDGGWRDLDKTIAEDLQRRGIPVVGWDCLRYFWSKKTPAQTARDLGAVLESFQDKWHADQIALVGYSFGADVLPFAYNRLPEQLRSHVILIALLGFAKSADFEVTVSGWLGAPSGAGALPIEPEADKIPASLIQCFYGQAESDTLCPTLAKRGVETIRTGGAHHFGGSYAPLAARILEGLKHRGAALPPMPSASSAKESLGRKFSSARNLRARFLLSIVVIILVLMAVWAVLRRTAR